VQHFENYLFTLAREIIDESDVYVDVHKAIRRSHPAPKARVQRKDLMVKDAAVKDGKLIDVDDETDGQTLQKVASTGGRVESAAMLSSSPRTTLLMRRSSTGRDGQLVRTTVPVKANYEEMRDHLKHLGPSNPASNPKSTNISSVKIKPGSNVRSVSTAAEHHEYTADTNGANERTSLLGKKDRDEPSRNYTTPPPQEPATENQPLLVVTEEDAPKPADAQKSPEVKAVVTTTSPDESPVSATSASTGLERPRTKRGVRSGSINEIEVSTGGVRKFVLEATSSGDEVEGGSNKSSPTTLRQASEDEAQATTTTDSPPETPAAESSNAGTESNQGGSSVHGSQKKKKNKKKKKGTRF
jgi:metal transporter CNNM